MKYFSVEQANRTLPLVRKVVGDIVHDYARWKDRVRQYEVLSGRAHGEETPEQVAMRGEVEGLAERINSYMEELAAVGCVFKGFDEGLVDFYGRRDGRDILLCWKLGEPSVQYWHEIDGGYSGRKPLVLQPVEGDRH